MTFGGNNPSGITLSMNGVSLPWVSKVKYLGGWEYASYVTLAN